MTGWLGEGTIGWVGGGMIHDKNEGENAVMRRRGASADATTTTRRSCR